MKYLFIILVVLNSPCITNAQSSNSISGIVRNVNSEPIAGATVSLFLNIDTIPYKTILTLNNGKFKFPNLPESTYTISVSSVGNTAYKSSLIKIGKENSSITLPPVVLSPLAKELKEVMVTSSKPLIQQDIDKTIINVEAMISSATSSALEVLQKSPGVVVNTDGDVILNGKAGVLILIDGRNTYMSAQDLAAYLKSLPGVVLDKIELITNPSSKYDAAGGSIINIRLKKSRSKGFNGNVSASYNQGLTARTYEALNLSFGGKKLTTFGTITHGRDANDGKDIYDRGFYTGTGVKSSSLQLNTHSISNSNSVNGRIGMDYTLSHKTTVGFVFTINNRPRKEKTDYTANNFNAIGMLDSLTIGNTDCKYKWTNTGINLNVTHKLNENGKELSADLNYINYTNNGNQLLPNVVYAPNGNIISTNTFLFTVPSSVNIYSAKADYVHPLAKNASIETGVKLSLVKNNNESSYYTVVGNSNTPDYSKSNHFLYDENINAAYISGRKNWKRIGLQIGLRLENTATYGHQLGNIVTQESSFRINYTNLFPTAFFSYQIDSLDKHTITASYAKRLQRPNYQQLNPFVFYRDKYSYTTGNPGLNPAHNYHLELNYRYQQYFGIGVQYDHVTDIVFQTTESTGNIFTSKPANIANGQFIGLSANGSISPFKWWNFNPWMFYAHVINKGKVGSENLNQIINHIGVDAFNEFKLSKTWSGELYGLYLSRLIAGQVIYESKYRFDIAVKVKILKDKGSLKLSFDDILHSWKQNETTISINGATSYKDNISDTRRVGLSFNYNFGKDIFARKRRHDDNAADDEKRRVD
ncbi:MAG: outer membrane beta-barrel protein [Bacteroidetes bacterium]|nr:outer membrane beta-barrel protein [Bacteroidota bacterium]